MAQTTRSPLIATASPSDVEAERTALYRRCSEDELKEFMKTRTHGGKTQIHGPFVTLEELLLQLDYQATFPFMKLPKDIRLMIEEELLSRAGSGLHSQILSTCKTVQDEAQGFLDKTGASGEIHLVRILTYQDCASVTVSSTHGCSCTCKRSPTTIRHGTTPATTISAPNQLDKELAAYPSISATATHLIIDIVIQGPCGSAVAHIDRMINHHLYLLTTTIQHTNIARVSLRPIHAKILDERESKQMLWPFSRLGPNITCTISGSSPELIADLHNKQVAASYTTTALTGWLELKTMADELASRVRKAGLKKTGIQFLPRLLTSIFASRYRHEAIDDVTGPPGSTAEECIAHIVAEARKILRNDRWAELSKQADAVLSKVDTSED